MYCSYKLYQMGLLVTFTPRSIHWYALPVLPSPIFTPLNARSKLQPRVILLISGSATTQKFALLRNATGGLCVLFLVCHYSQV